ncbi:MAG: glycosyltransferase family 2 protein [Actinomycetota bacterium]
MSETSVVILTMGDRPEAIAEAISSARAQRAATVEIVVVGNGAPIPEEVDADVRVELGENVGIPEGRNRGAAAASAERILFLDDDGVLVDADVLERAGNLFARNPQLAVVGLGIIDEHGASARRHGPRLRGRSSGEATSFPGGASIVRREAFEQVGGLAGPFFYALEETDLAWRLLDAGWTVHYEPELRMRHPRSSPARHPSFVERTARNRVWLAHRSLPWPLAITYVAIWTLITAVRARGRPSTVRSHLAGTIDGIRAPLGPRHPMSWRTAAIMTRQGRPPIV